MTFKKRIKKLEKQIQALHPDIDLLLDKCEKIDKEYTPAISKFVIEYIREFYESNNSIVRYLEYDFLIRNDEISYYCAGCNRQVAIIHPIANYDKVDQWLDDHYFYCPTCQHSIGTKALIEKPYPKR